MLKVVASEKFQHFVCTLTLGPLVLLTSFQTAEAEIVVVLLHVVAIVRNGAQTENKLSTHFDAPAQ